MQRTSRMPAGGRTGAIRALAALALLSMPFVLAFASGGYFDAARNRAGVVAAVVLALTAISVRRPLPRTAAGRLAVGGLWALTAWTAASMTWAPLQGLAFHDTQRLLLYAMVLTAAVALFRERSPARAAEPAAAVGCLTVIGYALAGRLLPAIAHEAARTAANGRLDQPLTYWNAVGAVAALGLVLCARIAGDASRAAATRAAAAAGCVPLGMGLYLTFSRGALAAAAAGLLVLVALAPQRSQLRAIGIAGIGAALGAVAAAPFPAVASLAAGSRGVQGAAVLCIALAVALAAALVQRRLALREDAGELSVDPVRLRGLRAGALIAACAVAVMFVVATVAGESRSSNSSPVTGANPTRLTSLRSHRYAYWNVALGAFADHPLEGLGSGNFSVRWLQKRHFREAVLDAHSLYVETAAELGLAGLAALAAFLAGIALAARRVLRRDAALAAGLVGAIVTWAGQAGVDWLWEMPAVTLVALVLAGTLIAAAEAGARPDGRG